MSGQSCWHQHHGTWGCEGLRVWSERDLESRRHGHVPHPQLDHHVGRPRRLGGEQQAELESAWSIIGSEGFPVIVFHLIILRLVWKGTHRYWEDLLFQIVKMALMVIARYNFIFTRPRLVCSTKLGAMFRGLLFSVIMLQVWINNEYSLYQSLV